MNKEEITIGNTVKVKDGLSSAMGKEWTGIVEIIEKDYAIVNGVGFPIDSLEKIKK